MKTRIGGFHRPTSAVISANSPRNGRLFPIRGLAVYSDPLFLFPRTPGAIPMRRKISTSLAHRIRAVPRASQRRSGTILGTLYRVNRDFRKLRAAAGRNPLLLVGRNFCGAPSFRIDKWGIFRLHMVKFEPRIQIPLTFKIP